MVLDRSPDEVLASGRFNQEIRRSTPALLVQAAQGKAEEMPIRTVEGGS
jgi:hypothetical protein